MSITEGSAEEAPEQHGGSGSDGCEDEVELSNLQWDGDQPVDVSHDERRFSDAGCAISSNFSVGGCPVLAHVGVVVPCNTRDECGDGHGGLHLAATLFRSMMKKTVDASIIAVASQNETPTMSFSSSLAPSADTAPRVIRNSIPVNSRLLLFEISVFMVLKPCYPKTSI